MANQHTHTCGIAAMMNIFGDRWTLLLVREAFYGASRFTEFRRNTGASRNILTDRLNALVENGIFQQIEVGLRGKPTPSCDRPDCAAAFGGTLWAGRQIWRMIARLSAVVPLAATKTHDAGRDPYIAPERIADFLCKGTRN
jgi:hypothetical protein